MKKYLLYTLMLLSGFSFSSCSDNDEPAAETNREFMTMFICDNNRGKGEDYPYNSKAEGPNGNDIHLYWYGVNDCAGYQIRQALLPNVSGGADAWGISAENGLLLLDTIVGPEVLDLVIKDQQYSTDFRFAIRVLSKKDDNITDFSHASKWYGHGEGRQWAEYLPIKTADRYATPFCVYVDGSKTTETTMRVMLNRDWDVVTGGVSAEDKEIYREQFETDGDKFVYQWLEVAVSPTNPESTVGEKWKKYRLTEEDFAKGYVDIDGLQKNSVYVINVRNENVKVKWDAYYNTYSARSDGEPGEPIVVTHNMTAPSRDYFESQESYETAMRQHEVALKYNAMRIDFMLTDFISDVELAEGQEFYLEGGKTYCMFNNQTTCKGFVLRTHPDDLAAGKRAKVLLGGMHKEGTNVKAMNFVFGRQPQAGEAGEIYMKMLEFYDIDFDCPLAETRGDLGGKDGTGNYFINMYSNGMAIHLEKLIIKNCTFKRMVRGFIREQGPNYKIWDNVLIEDNQFFDCGYYNLKAGGYPWIAGAGTNANSNLYKNFIVRNNTFFDSPFPSFFSEAVTKNFSTWKGGPWNITFENNTLVNFNTRGGNIFSMRNISDGSVFNVKNNLIILTKQDGDARKIDFRGADIQKTMDMGDGSGRGKVTLNFENNYSTNTLLNKGQIFSAGLWSATSKSFGELVKDKYATLNGTLDVLVDDISPTELMISPNPPHKASGDSDQYMHRADALDGTAGEHGANLFYNKTDKVLNSQIYKLGIGDKRWRQ